MTRISVVKDDPDILETMADILDWLEGHDVAGFDGGETTVEQLIASRPELLIVDLRLAGDQENGWEMLKLARSTPELRDVPLIVCSADVISLRDRSADLARLGNVHVLEMPFSIEDFEAVIEQALDGTAPSDRRPPPPPH
jgi:CheY-like chemotaxis protein